MRKFFLLFAVVLTLLAGQQSMAARVLVYFDNFNVNPSTYDVLVSVCGNATGIASYGLPVVGGFDLLDHNSPHTGFARDATLVGGPAGFSFLRSDDGAALLGAAQDTITPTPHLIDGFGLSAGSFASEGLNPIDFTPDGDSWDAALRIATVTYSGDPPSIDISSQGGAFINIFLPTGGIEAAELTFHIPFIDGNNHVCPEPTALAFAGLGMVGLLGSRRRRASIVIKENARREFPAVLRILQI